MGDVAGMPLAKSVGDCVGEASMYLTLGVGVGDGAHVTGAGTGQLVGTGVGPKLPCTLAPTQTYVMGAAVGALDWTGASVGLWVVGGVGRSVVGRGEVGCGLGDPLGRFVGERDGPGVGSLVGAPVG